MRFSGTFGWYGRAQPKLHTTMIGQHPGRTYFPYNPLAVLLAEGKLTHFDHALWDRELAGFPVSAEQFAAGLPSGYELVAYPPHQRIRAEILRRLLKDQPQVNEPGLRGWRVFRMTTPATRSTFIQSTSGSPP